MVLEVGQDSEERAVMGQKFTPKLWSTDWNDEWKELQNYRERANDAAYWNKRSATFTPKDFPGSYTEKFLELAAIEPNETVFDMGCGTGALSIPLALRGNKVLACDFSQGMLDRMNEEIERKNAHGITSKILSWSDDWHEYGIGDKSVDVALASRSIADEDLKSALLKLDAVAKRRVCITVATGSSPRSNMRILSEIGLEPIVGRDYLYAFNILTHEGIFPDITYITSTRKDMFESLEEGRNYYRDMVEHSTVTFDSKEITQALSRLDDWLDIHLIKNPHNGQQGTYGVEKAYFVDVAQVVRWAFISWDARPIQ